MAAAQKYPKDFDGIISGSPAFDYNSLKAYQIHVNSFLANKTSDGYIPAKAYPLIKTAVLKACDSADGVADDIVSNADACKPDFAALVGCTKLGIKPYDETDQVVAPVSAAVGQDAKTFAVDSKLSKPAKTPADEDDPKTSLSRRGITSTVPIPLRE